MKDRGDPIIEYFLASKHLENIINKNIENNLLCIKLGYSIHFKTPNQGKTYVIRVD